MSKSKGFDGTIVSVNSKTPSRLIFHFEEYFNLKIEDKEQKELIDRISVVPLSRKMTFSKMSKSIAETIEKFAAGDPEFILMYFNLHREFLIWLKKISDGEEDKPYPYDQMKDTILSTLDGKYQQIKDHVDKIYNGDLVFDEKKSEESQFTNEHSKILLCTGIATRLIVPIITNYITLFSIRDDRMFLDIHIPIIEGISRLYEKDLEEETGEPVTINIQNKLRKLIDNRVQSTQYSDRVIWGYLPNASINPTEYSNQLYRKIIIDIIPKLINDSVVSFLHVVTRNQISFLFKSKLPISYKPLNQVANNNNTREDMADFNVFDSYFDFKRDESAVVRSNVEVEKLVRDLYREVGREVCYDEVNHYSQKLEITHEQRRMAVLFIMNRISNRDTTASISIKDYIAIVKAMSLIFKQEGFDIMSRVLLSNYREEDIIYRNNINKTLQRKIEDSESYNSMVRGKYRYVANRMDSNRVVYNMIMPWLRYKRTSVSKDDFGVDIEYKPELLMSEMLEFISRTVR